MPNKNSIYLTPPAKVNLFLHIVGRNKDTYHELQSLVYFADFGDEITITEAEVFSFSSNNKSIQTDDNIIVKAAQSLSKELNQPLYCSITLNKKIPIGAGLGGGSSDAAAVIKGLLEFWDISEPPTNLESILLSLGADVPSCYHGRACYFENIGEIITPIQNAPDLYGVLVNPHIACATKDIFSKIKPPFKNSITLPAQFDSSADLIDFLKEQNNDLTPAACQTIPEIQNVLDYLSMQDENLLTRMSGSGATCFSLFETKEKAKHCALSIQKENPQWWVQAVTLK